MKYTLSLILFFSVIVSTNAQTKTNSRYTDIETSCGVGWSVQSCSKSFDGKTMIISAKAPGRNNNDLYAMYRTADAKWSNPVRLSSNINSEKNEFYPQLSSDEQTLYFVRHLAAHQSANGHEQFTIMVSYKEDRVDGLKWTRATPIIISEGEEISPCLLPDGQTLIYASSKPIGKSKAHQYALYYTRRLGQYNWYTPKLLLTPKNANENIYDPEYFAGEGRPIIRYTQQICDKKDTTYRFGQISLPEEAYSRPVLTARGIIQEMQKEQTTETELYIYDALTNSLLAHMACRGDYMVALAAGKLYKLDFTADNLSHTYLTYDCRNLQADSVARKDVRLSKTLSIRAYLFDSETNMPILNYSTEIARGKITRGKGYSDINISIGQEYTLKFSKQGYIDTTFVIDTRKPILLTSSEIDISLRPKKVPLNIEVRNAEDSVLISTAKTTIFDSERKTIIYNNGTELREGETYSVFTTDAGYAYADTVIEVPYSLEPLHYTFYLQPLRENLIIRLKNIQFELNSAELMDESFAELDKVVEVMKNNPELRIELSAHTDNVGTDQYNDRLSQRRGDVAKTYLVKAGVEASRIQAIGYGKRRPLTSNDTEEAKQLNRRVEFKVIK